MDDINKAISDVLADPTKLELLKNMANSIFSEGGEQPSSKGSQNGQNPLSALGALGEIGNPSQKNSPQQSSGLNFADILGNAQNIGGLIKAAGALQQSGNDDSVRLLLALKPHLSQERSARVDRAVKILSILKIAPLLEKSGLLKLLG